MFLIVLKRGLIMKTLAIKLAAPLQSYGNEATFSYRTSYHYPSKSAVLGMIAAALGYRRNDSRIVKLNQLKMAVRIDQPGKTLTDYQTTKYGPKSKDVTISHRNYLQDAVYMVAISGDDDQIDLINFALHHPKFQLYLGRRANVPAGPLMTTLFNLDPISVLKHYEWQAAEWFQRRHRNQANYSVEIIADNELIPSNISSLVKDNIGSFDQNRRWHLYRAVSSMTISLPNKFCQEKEHDVFANI